MEQVVRSLKANFVPIRTKVSTSDEPVRTKRKPIEQEGFYKEVTSIKGKGNRPFTHDKTSNKTEIVRAIQQNPHLLTRAFNDRSLYHFLQWAWPILNSQKFVPNWHIKYLCQELEKVAYQVGSRTEKIYDLLINIPPGSTKTMLITIIFPVWCWTKWFWMRFITASYSGDLALESAEASRDLIKSDEFRMVYPEYVIKTDKDKKSNFRIAKIIENPTGRYHVAGRPTVKLGGYRYSTSVGGTLTGYHGDILIWDDPLNPQQAASDKEVDTANNWIDQTLPTRKTSKENSVTIGIMQRLKENDPTGHILEKEKKNTKHICLPGEIFGYKHMVKPAGLVKYYINGLFDPRRLSQKVLDELLVDLGGYGYAGQIGQSPAVAGGNMFHVSQFVMVHSVPESEIISRVRFWDKAATQDGGTYTCGVLLAMMKNKQVYIEDVKRGQWSTNVREKVIRQTAEEDGENVAIWIEQEPGSGGKDSAQATMLNLIGFSIRAEKPTGDKTQRATPYSIHVNNGNVLMKIAAWNLLYKAELELFPKSRYKDQTDASSGAFNKLLSKKEVRRIT